MSEMTIDDGGGRQKTAKVNYPSNARADKGKPQKPLIEQVTTGVVTQRRKPLMSRITESVTGDSTQSVGEYIVLEVLLPAAKNMISDAVSQGIDRLLFGESRRAKSGERPGYTNYQRASTGTSNYQRRDISPRSRATHDFDDIVLATRSEAEDVLDRLQDLIKQYEVAKVADLYDLVGISGSFTDDRWGWTDLRDARVRNIRGGYLLELPRTQPID